MIDILDLFAAVNRGAGMSGGDNVAIAAQAGRKTLQGAVLMGGAAGDEERLDPGLRGRDPAQEVMGTEGYDRPTILEVIIRRPSGGQ